ncbi:MAG: hypothetical protein GF353_13110 [Candidatus Lokiarchaeota archaeon]|nr:hypothetical protein [Candidatus Lokiarchaeota archaeon]
MKILFLLSIIIDYPNGITIYQLHSKFNFSRGMLMNTFDSLEKEGHLTIRKDEVKGREQKYFIITKEGREYLNKLKSKWANHFAIMSEIAPPEHYGKEYLQKGFRRILIRGIEVCESKEDVLDYLKGMRSWVKSMIRRIERRKQHLDYKQKKLSEIIQKIYKIESCENKKIISVINMYFKK